MATSGIPRDNRPVEWLWQFNRSLTMAVNTNPLLTFYQKLAILCASKRGTNLPIRHSKGEVMASPIIPTKVMASPKYVLMRTAKGRIVPVLKALAVRYMLQGWRLV